MPDHEYSIQIADTASRYEGLRSLWYRIFGDSPEYVDHVYDVFGEDIRGYVICSEEGAVISSLTCYRCGSLEGTPVYVSYAVCTDPEYRGLGLAGRLTDYVRSVVTGSRGAMLNFENAPNAEGLGGISIVSPAEDSLVSFYREAGYEESCYVNSIRVMPGDEDTEDFIMGEDDDFEAFDPSLRVSNSDASEYNMYREAFLANEAHVSLSGKMLELVRSESMDGNGLLIINGGDAICAVSGNEDGILTASEFIVNPMLREFSEEIDEELAEQIADYYGAAGFIARVPAFDLTENCIVQSMAAGRRDLREFYFGFPIE